VTMLLGDGSDNETEGPLKKEPRMKTNKVCICIITLAKKTNSENFSEKL